MIDGKSLNKKARSTLVCFLTQCIWTRTRLRQAGYEVEEACQCGAQQDTLKRRLLECSLSAQLREEMEFTADELGQISNLSDQVLAFGFRFSPAFDSGVLLDSATNMRTFGVGTHPSRNKKLSRMKFSRTAPALSQGPNATT
eukprot:6821626-Pyramimonas_sp.AAC.1